MNENTNEKDNIKTSFDNEKSKPIEAVNKAKVAIAGIGQEIADNAKKVKNVFDEKAPEVIEKVGEAADKTKEFAMVAKEGANQAVKNAHIWIKAKIDSDAERRFIYDKDTLMPIFDNQIPEDYSIYPVVNIVNTDEKRSKSKACNGSIGFKTEAKDVNVLNIYTSKVNLFPIALGVDPKEGVYYANPYIPNEYIESSQYAIYLKEERVRELVNIADSLGAKKVSVAFVTKENKKEEQNVKLDLKIGKNKSKIEAEQKLRESLKLSIVKSETYKGHDHPVRPNLVYYKNVKNIEELIEKRINGTNQLLNHSYSIAYATLSSAKKKEAVKIDNALKILKLGVSESLSVCSEVESELVLNYKIEF